MRATPKGGTLFRRFGQLSCRKALKHANIREERAAQLIAEELTLQELRRAGIAIDDQPTAPKARKQPRAGA